MVAGDDPGAAVVPDGGEVPQRLNQDGEGGERAGRLRRRKIPAQRKPQDGNRGRCCPDFGQPAQQLAPPRPGHCGPADGGTVFAQGLQLGPVAAHEPEFGRRRRALHDGDGEFGAPAAELPMHGRHPDGDADHHPDAHGKRNGRCRSELGAEQHQGDDASRHHDEGGDDARQPQADPVARSGKVADEADGQRARPPGGDGSGRHARQVREEHVTKRDDVILPHPFGEAAAADPERGNYDAGEEQNQERQQRRGDSWLMQRLEDVAGREGVRTGGKGLPHRR
jgi:hypothetical protein